MLTRKPYKPTGKSMKVKLISLALVVVSALAIFFGYEGAINGNNSIGSENGNEQIVETYASSSELPEYSGQDIIELNGNVPEFTDADRSLAAGTENYSRFDHQGRAGGAIAVVGKETMPTEKRKQLSFKPTGWVQANYQDELGIDHLYERCHLLAHSLTAENDNPNNLITGTQYMNNLMIPYENQVAQYVDRTKNHVLYRVTPIFSANELVARGVQMEAYSIEDNGEGVCYNVAIYNKQPNVVIDYMTGKSMLAQR